MIHNIFKRRNKNLQRFMKYWILQIKKDKIIERDKIKHLEKWNKLLHVTKTDIETHLEIFHIH